MYAHCQCRFDCMKSVINYAIFLLGEKSVVARRQSNSFRLRDGVIIIQHLIGRRISVIYKCSNKSKICMAWDISSRI